MNYRLLMTAIVVALMAGCVSEMRTAGSPESHDVSMPRCQFPCSASQTPGCC